MVRPSLIGAWKVFQEVNAPPQAVARLIGGLVEYNFVTFPQEFANACCVRISYVLNRTGFMVPQFPKATISGRQKEQYIFRLVDLIPFLERAFGNPNISVQNPTRRAFQGHGGILVFVTPGWSNASGHATIWSGSDCADACFFSDEKHRTTNEFHKTTNAFLWTLPGPPIVTS